MSSGPAWYGRRVAEAAANGDDHAVEATQRIGERLAYLRSQRNLKISDLARRIGVSPSLISQIERGQSRPSVTTLFALAQALAVPVDAFFESGPLSELEAAAAAAVGSDERGRAMDEAIGTLARARAESVRRAGEGLREGERYLLKHDERPTVDIRGGVRWERLTRTPLNDLEFMELVYEPGAESDPQLYRHPGLECVVVIENRLDITIGFEVNQVMAGDSIAFPSSLPHRYVNPTSQVSRAITVILRDDLSALPPIAGPGEQAE
jgi:transcriptional regulator with XRE-family HTH domain